MFGLLAVFTYLYKCSVCFLADDFLLLSFECCTAVLLHRLYIHVLCIILWPMTADLSCLNLSPTHPPPEKDGLLWESNPHSQQVEPREGSLHKRSSSQIHIVANLCFDWDWGPLKIPMCVIWGLSLISINCWIALLFNVTLDFTMYTRPSACFWVACTKPSAGDCFVILIHQSQNNHQQKAWYRLVFGVISQPCVKFCNGNVNTLYYSLVELRLTVHCCWWLIVVFYFNQSKDTHQLRTG